MEFEIVRDVPAKRVKKRSSHSALEETRITGGAVESAHAERPDGPEASPGTQQQAQERTLAGSGEQRQESVTPQGAQQETGCQQVEVEILRIPPNPQLVICRYWVLGEERRCMVRVGRNSNFVPRMKFWLQEPGDPAARRRPWPYVGRLPRRRGWW
jgi:hypothetical protein